MLHRLTNKVARALFAPMALAVTVGLTTPSIAESPTDILRSLAPGSGYKSSRPHPDKYRSVPVYTDKGGRVDTWVDYSYRVDLTVYFAYNSSEIGDRAQRELYHLGRALQDPSLRPYRYLIAGHTDAAGSVEYNEALSLRRANAVRSYLIRAFGVEPWRLYTAGFGQRQLRDRSQPYSGVNRRVEVVLVADPSYAPGPTSGPPPGYGAPGYGPPARDYAPAPGYAPPRSGPGYAPPPPPAYGSPRSDGPCATPTDPRPRPGKDDDFGRRPADCPPVSSPDSVIIK